MFVRSETPRDVYISKPHANLAVIFGNVWQAAAFLWGNVEDEGSWR